MARTQSRIFTAPEPKKPRALPRWNCHDASGNVLNTEPVATKTMAEAALLFIHSQNWTVRKEEK